VTWPENIAIIGAGALGGYYGARLIQHEYDVHLHMRSDAAHVATNGLQIESLDGDFTLPPEKVRAYENVETIPKVDLVIVTLKSTANGEFRNLITPLLKDDSAILTLQNGLGNDRQLAELFGARRILAGNAFVCINRITAGHIRHLDHGLIRLGEMSSPATPRALAIAEMLSSSKVPCQAIDNVAAGQWDKLIWNIPFNGLGAMLGLTTDKIIGNPTGLALAKSIMREVISASGLLKYKFPDSVIDQKIKHTETMGAYKTSMQIDRELVRPMEIEAIFGEPLRIAQRADANMPLLEMMYRSLSLLDRKS
jgi:2-dehydropantoate 2-reductase